MKPKVHGHKSSSIIISGKRIFFIVAMLTIPFFQKSFAQESSTQIQSQLSQLLTLYYNIKDALVAGNVNSASINAEQFVKTANGIDYKVISEGNISALLTDATAISESKDIKEQRIHFANLSANMFTVAKAIRLTDQPVYQVYCPMKKAYWLSSDKAIKNPYFGNAMIICGKVTETLQ
jgi:hypothetical protein